MRRMSLALSIGSIALWSAAVALMYFGGPIWLQVFAGVTGCAVALADYKYVRSQAREKVLRLPSK
jgi:hypothetical protein